MNKTLGLYAQEQASFRDRLFLTVAARTDQNSAFGTKFQRVFYPKASVSWIISDESFFPHFDWLNQLRLRSAYGASGVQPGGTVAFQTFNARDREHRDDAGATGRHRHAGPPRRTRSATRTSSRSARRRSEAASRRACSTTALHFDFTYYNKKTHDALISQPIAASSGASTLSVRQEPRLGLEHRHRSSTLNTTLIDRRALGWDITVAASHNSNKILSLGIDASGQAAPDDRHRHDARLGRRCRSTAFFARPFTFADANGDGIITPNEVTVSPNFVYIGYSLPRDIVSITNGFDLFNRKLRITALTDYKGGFILYNQSGQFYSPNFPTWYSRQPQVARRCATRRARVANSSAKNPSTVDSGYLENGQFWKLREVSAALTLPNVGRQQDPRARRAARLLGAQPPHVDEVHRHGSGSELQHR